MNKWFFIISVLLVLFGTLMMKLVGLAIFGYLIYRITAKPPSPPRSEQHPPQ